MEVRSFARNAGIAPKKARVILDEIRGKRVDEAMSLLRLRPRRTPGWSPRPCAPRWQR
jgi:large subunit ribosomal protein L22